MKKSSIPQIFETLDGWKPLRKSAASSIWVLDDECGMTLEAAEDKAVSQAWIFNEAEREKVENLMPLPNVLGGKCIEKTIPRARFIKF